MKEIEKYGVNDMWYVFAFLGGMFVGMAIAWAIVLVAAIREVEKYQDE